MSVNKLIAPSNLLYKRYILPEIFLEFCWYVSTSLSLPLNIFSPCLSIQSRTNKGAIIQQLLLFASQIQQVSDDKQYLSVYFHYTGTKIH